MRDYFLKHLRNRASRFRGADNLGKKNIILGTFVLILGMGIFFNAFFKENVYAKKSLATKEVSPEDLDPLNRIGKGLFSAERTVNICNKEKGVPKKDNLPENPVRSVVSGHPMEKMAEHIAKRKKSVAAFLVAIAKKESDWGTHSPKKSGRDCYNYWGYRGTYNQTASGYSCFDSPEQAIQVVGDRIESLIEKNVDTPEKMIVWKCGSTCAGHDQGDVRKWIADVNLYYKKLDS